MDVRPPDHRLISLIHNHPAHIWIGNPAMLAQQASKTIQQLCCSSGGCGNCTTCSRIAQKQYQSLLWLCPEKGYTREYLETVFETMAFSVDKDHLFFIILEKADEMNAACANSLLKMLEEPPVGYRFIFMTQRSNALLPTIRSRCIIQQFSQDTVAIKHPLMDLLTTAEKINAMHIMDLLEKELPNEQESSYLLDSLMAHWSKEYQSAIQAGNIEKSKKAAALLNIFQTALTMQPMPGSSKIFWRTLLLRYLYVTFFVNGISTSF